MANTFSNLQFQGGEKVQVPNEILVASGSILSGYALGNDFNKITTTVNTLVSALNAAPVQLINNKYVWGATSGFIGDLGQSWTTPSTVSSIVSSYVINILNQSKFLTYKSLYNYYDICEINHIATTLSGYLNTAFSQFISHKDTKNIHYQIDNKTVKTYDNEHIYVDIHELETLHKNQVLESSRFVLKDVKNNVWDNYTNSETALVAVFSNGTTLTVKSISVDEGGNWTIKDASNNSFKFNSNNITRLNIPTETTQSNYSVSGTFTGNVVKTLVYGNWYETNEKHDFLRRFISHQMIANKYGILKPLQIIDIPLVETNLWNLNAKRNIIKI
jgi:hypothetical protein